MTEEEWERLKEAALEYALYRPRLLPATITPVTDQTEYEAPEGAIGVQNVSYGDELTLAEAAAAAEGTTGWHYYQGTLYLVPTPSEDVTLVWRLSHAPDEATQSFPTIPAADMRLVRWLAAAEEADEQQSAVEMGMTSYTIGGTTVKWGQSGGGTSSTASRSVRLREKAISQLQEPLADWG